MIPPIEVLQELDSFFMGSGRIELLQFSEGQNLIQNASFDLVEFIWFTARLWCRLPFCRLHLWVHEELIDHCCCIVWVIGDQLQVFDWQRCDVGCLMGRWYSEVCQVGVGFKCVHVLIGVGDLNHRFSII